MAVSSRGGIRMAGSVGVRLLVAVWVVVQGVPVAVMVAGWSVAAAWVPSVLLLVAAGLLIGRVRGGRELATVLVAVTILVAAERFAAGGLLAPDTEVPRERLVLPAIWVILDMVCLGLLWLPREGNPFVRAGGRDR